MASGNAASSADHKDLAISGGLRTNQRSYDNKCYPQSKSK